MPSTGCTVAAWHVPESLHDPWSSSSLSPDVTQGPQTSWGQALTTMRTHVAWRQEHGISTMTEAIAFGKMLLERAEAVGMQRTRVSKTRGVLTCLGDSNAPAFR